MSLRDAVDKYRAARPAVLQLLRASAEAQQAAAEAAEQQQRQQQQRTGAAPAVGSWAALHIKALVFSLLCLA